MSDKAAAGCGLGNRPLEAEIVELHVLEALKRLAEHCALPDLSLRGIASELKLSACYLGRIISFRNGLGYRSHIKRFRMARAADELAHSLLSVKEISGTVGYSRSSNFVRDFKEIHGMTPLRYRVAFRLDRSRGHSDPTAGLPCVRR